MPAFVAENGDPRRAVDARDGRVGERVREEVERADKGHAGVIAGLHRADKADGAAGDEGVFGQELVRPGVEAVRGRACVEDVGEERLTTDLVANTAVEQRGPGLGRGRDEGRLCAGEGDDER